LKRPKDRYYEAMNIYLLYKTDDMNNMTQIDVREVRNKLEGSLASKPVYDLAVIDSVLWRVGVINTDESPGELKTRCKRLDIPLNSQGFQGTALSSEGNKVSEEFIYKIHDTDRSLRNNLNLSSTKKKSMVK
jgi:hypothetical protein